MLPLNLINTPLQTQVQRVYHALAPAVYVHFIDTVQVPVADPRQLFRGRLNGTPIAPTTVFRIEGNQYLLLFPASPTDTLDYLYFYGGFPPIPLIRSDRTDFLLPNYWSIDFFRFLYPQPLQLAFLIHTGIQVFVDLDRDIASGSTDPADWIVYRLGAPRPVFSVSISGSRVTLLVLGIPPGNLSRVDYIKGSTPFIANDRGQMESWSFNFPFPTPV